MIPEKPGTLFDWGKENETDPPVNAPYRAEKRHR
jgi:hypothetical protein